MERRARARRRIGAIVCLAPVLVLALSLAVGIARPRAAFPGLVLVGLALLIGLLNLWFAFGRRFVHLARGLEPGTYRPSSGLPVVGMILVLLGCAVSFGSPWTAALGLLALAIDTGGSPWFLAATWKDESLWAGS